MSAPAPAEVVAWVAERFGADAGVDPLFGDASTRRYFRIRAGSERAVLALHPEGFDCDRLPFVEVQRLLAGWGLPVPSILACDGSRRLLLLEDLGDRTLQSALAEPGTDAATRRELYEQALDQLVVLQREGARPGQRGSCFGVAFDLEKLSWELHYFERHFLEGQRGSRLSVEDRATLARSFQQLAGELASWPRVLCHRDFHSRNLMLAAGRLYWLDFQDARMGPASYDLASLMRDSYVELDEEFVQSCAEQFRQRAAPAEPAEVFFRRLELTSIQRNLKALGTFGFQAAARGNPVYLPYVRGTLASVRRNLERHPEHAPLRRVLARHIEELD